jgi:Ni/Co efflux regulator RcnB
MKRLLSAALALSLFAGTAAVATSASAQTYDHGRYDRQDDRGDYRRDDRRDDRGDYRRDDHRDDRGGYRHDGRGQYGGYHNGYNQGGSYGYGYGNQYGYGHRWARGQRYDHGYGGRYVDYRGYNLRRPPRGYGWVQDRNDFLLVALAGGLIAQIISQ